MVPLAPGFTCSNYVGSEPANGSHSSLSLLPSLCQIITLKKKISTLKIWKQVKWKLESKWGYIHEWNVTQGHGH